MFRNREKFVKIVVWVVVLSMLISIFAALSSVF